MNLFLSVGEWFKQNWMILVLIVIAVALLGFSYYRQKKEMANRNETNRQIKKGVKIITTAGVYGTVEKVVDTTDGQVVTIVTGNKNNPTTMDIHINAIAGIDNKSIVNADVHEEKVEPEKVEKVEEKTEVADENADEVVAQSTPKKTATKSTAKKSTKKSK